MKKSTAAKLESFVPLGVIVRRKFTAETIPFNDLRREFYTARTSGNRQKAEAILDKLWAAFRVKRPQGKLDRHVHLALLYLPADRKPTISEIFRIVHQWEKSYTEMGVRKAVRRTGLDFFISAGKRGRPPKT